MYLLCCIVLLLGVVGRCAFLHLPCVFLLFVGCFEFVFCAVVCYVLCCVRFSLCLLLVGLSSFTVHDYIYGLLVVLCLCLFNVCVCVCLVFELFVAPCIYIVCVCCWLVCLRWCFHAYSYCLLVALCCFVVRVVSL